MCLIRSLFLVILDAELHQQVRVGIEILPTKLKNNDNLRKTPKKPMSRIPDEILSGIFYDLTASRRLRVIWMTLMFTSHGERPNVFPAGFPNCCDVRDTLCSL